jgi:hypothetical protein
MSRGQEPREAEMRPAANAGSERHAVAGIYESEKERAV